MAEKTCEAKEPDTDETLYEKIESSKIKFGPQNKYYYKENSNDDYGNSTSKFIPVYVVKSTEKAQDVKPHESAYSLDVFILYTCNKENKYDEYLRVYKISRLDLYSKNSTTENNSEEKVGTLETKVEELETKVGKLETKVYALENQKLEGGKRSRKAKKQKRSGKRKSRSRK
jgi:hypothetical protein